jgi:hypothetical protein
MRQPQCETVCQVFIQLHTSQEWWRTAVIPVLECLRQENGESEASPGYTKTVHEVCTAVLWEINFPNWKPPRHPSKLSRTIEAHSVECRQSSSSYGGPSDTLPAPSSKVAVPSCWRRASSTLSTSNQELMEQCG